MGGGEGGGGGGEGGRRGGGGGGGGGGGYMSSQPGRAFQLRILEPQAAGQPGGSRKLRVGMPLLV